MTKRELSRKQVIVSISNENQTKFMEASSAHITNLNRALKNIRSKVMADFVQSKQAVIVTNKVVTTLDLQTIKRYVKNSNYINAEKVEVPQLSKFKLYLKIIGILYLMENTNTPILANIVKSIIRSNHIFNNIVITLRS